MWSWWVAAALAHGPAPVALDVLAWDDAGGCDDLAEAATPRLVRMNIGLGTHRGDGTYAYACPARWGDEEQALAASDPSGDTVLLAGSGSLFWSEDGGCSATALDLPEGDVPVDLAWTGEGFVFASRRFDDGTAALWRVRAGVLSEVGRRDDIGVDGVLVDAGTVWVAGARPAPSISTLGTAWTPMSWAFPEAGDVQRLALRGIADDTLWLVATTEEGRWLWRAEDGEVAVAAGPFQTVHGPARVEGRWLFVGDGVVWDGGAAGVDWSDSGLGVDWTCLRTSGPHVIACGLEAMRQVQRWDGEAAQVVPVFGLEQLDGPEPSCDGRDGACELDWLHFGGESGFVGTQPATCPGDARRLEPEPPETDVEACGCASSAGGGAAWGWAAMLWLRRRRRGVNAPARLADRGGGTHRGWFARRVAGLGLVGGGVMRGTLPWLWALAACVGTPDPPADTDGSPSDSVADSDGETDTTDGPLDSDSDGPTDVETDAPDTDVWLVGGCSAARPMGACPSEMACVEGACRFDIDPDEAKGDVGTVFAAYAAWAEPLDLLTDHHLTDWTSVRAEASAGIDAASTRFEASWAAHRAVAALGAGHTRFKLDGLCDADPGLAEVRSSLGACVEETPDGFVVIEATPESPFEPGDRVVALGGRGMASWVEDRLLQPRCEDARGTSEARRASAVGSVFAMPEGWSEEAAVLRSRVGWRTFDAATNPVPLPCPGRLPVAGAQRRAEGYSRAVLPGGAVVYAFGPLQSAVDGSLEGIRDALLIDLAVDEASPVIFDLRGSESGYRRLADVMLDALLPDDTLVRRCESRNGDGPEDVSGPFEVRTDGASGVSLSGRLAVISNGRTGGAAELVIYGVADAPTVALVGTPPQGSPSITWSYPSLRDAAVDGERCVDGAGTPMERRPPTMDIPVSWTVADARAGVDPALEAARRHVLDLP